MPLPLSAPEIALAAEFVAAVLLGVWAVTSFRRGEKISSRNIFGHRLVSRWTALATPAVCMVLIVQAFLARGHEAALPGPVLIGILLTGYALAILWARRDRDQRRSARDRARLTQ